MWLLPTSHLELEAPHCLQLSHTVCAAASLGSQELAQSLELSSIPLGKTLQPSALWPGPGLRVFKKVIRLSPVVSLVECQKIPIGGERERGREGERERERESVCVCVYMRMCVGGEALKSQHLSLHVPHTHTEYEGCLSP